MRTAIIGAGSMGIIIGAYLAKGGVDVELFDVNEPNIEALQKNGAKVVHVEERFTFIQPVKAYTLDKINGIYDLVLLLTKQSANPKALSRVLPHLDENSVVCTLQNGVPEPSVAEIVGTKRTIGGAMLFPGTWLENGVSAETGNYENFKNEAFNIGELDGTITPRLKMVQKILNNVGNTLIIDKLLETKWTKLIANCCGSGMSAALNCTFGQAIDDQRSLACMALIAREVVRVANEEGIHLMNMLGIDFDKLMNWNTKQEMLTAMKIFTTIFAPNHTGKASMLQDLEKKIVTEVDYINGLVVSLGKKHGIETPFCEKVVELVKDAEAKKSLNNMSYLSYFDVILEEYRDIFTVNL